MLKKLLLLVFVLSLFVGFAQNKSKDSLTLIVKNILNFKPSSYLEIENRFKSNIATEQKIKIFLEESIKSDSTLYIVYGYNSLGRYYRNVSNYSKALNFHKKAMKIAKHANSSKLEIITLNMIGSVYRRLDDVRKALNHNQKALKIANAIKQKDVDIKNSIAVSRNGIGNIYIALKQYNLALRELNIALEIQTALSSPVGKAINLQNIAFIQEQTGNLKEALKNYNKSLSYNLLLNNKVGIIICNNGIANTLIKQRKNKKALKRLELVVPLAEELKDPYYTSIVYASLGKVYTYLKDYKLAEKYLNLVIEISEKYKIKRSSIEGFKFLATLEADRGNYKKAYNYYKKYTNKEAKIVNKQNTIYVNKLLFDYENKVKAYELEKSEKENEKNSEQLRRDRNILIVILSILSLLSVVLYSMFRSKTLETEKKIVTLEQEALRSQMNPHFVFNALNSIKLYIINNDQKKAAYYLNKFSKLIRKILEASTIREITLEEELETMSLYMSIENIRFSNEINYETNISEGFDTFGVKVPPLVLQPFLENAIWHGLSTKKGIKKILVQASYEKNVLIIEIIDNGVGRKIAGKIKAEKSIKRKSIGINLTKERLSNFNKNYSLHYTDLIENNEIKGTKVTIKIPQS